MDGPALFRETQRFHANPWARFAILASLAGCGGALLALVARGEAVPPSAWLGLTVGGAVLALLLLGGLATEVRGDGLYLRFLPLRRWHRLGWDELVRAEARTYRPIREYGGWGIRGSRSGRAWNVHGDRGVQLELSDGRRLLVGSQRADELARAIASARGGA